MSGGAPALAQRSIGSAVTIEREVSGAIGGRTRSLNAGDGVVSNENIRTANASAAQLQFLDQTKLSIGPSASVVLDRFVYNPDGTARESVLRVTTGAARWVGGRSRPQAHEVRTPHAVIGVRGTIFDLLVEASRTIVTLREGVIVVCPIGAPQRCVTLDTPGQTVTVTRSAVEGPSRAGPSETRFADLCLRPVDRAACTVTTIAQLEPTPTWEGIFAGVHGGGVVGRPQSVNVYGHDGLDTLVAPGGVPPYMDTKGLGGLGGVQVGYMWQTGQTVFGVEADFSALSARAQGQVILDPCACLTATTTITQNIDYFGTVRGRAGFAVGDLLAYGTAGLAVGHIKMDGTIYPVPTTAPTYVGSSSLVRAGYVAGGGFELALAGALSVRAEYLHYDLGKQTLTLDEISGGAPGDTASAQFRTHGDIVRAGINYRFGASTAAGAFASAATAYAADYKAPVYKAPPPMVFSWSGFYAGAQGGAGWARKDWFFNSVAGVAVPPGSEGSHVATGGLAGGQIGFNYQVANWVWGVEAEASWAHLQGSNVSNIFPAPGGNRNVTRIDALGTVAGRLGIGWDRTLLYGKAGGAWALDNYEAIDLVSGVAAAKADEVRWGWMAGIGIERAFLDNWSVKVEYNFMDFGRRHVALDCVALCTGQVSEDIRQNVSVLKVGINYRFGGPIAARY